MESKSESVRSLERHAKKYELLAILAPSAEKRLLYRKQAEAARQMIRCITGTGAERIESR